MCGMTHWDRTSSLANASHQQPALACSPVGFSTVRQASRASRRCPGACPPPTGRGAASRLHRVSLHRKDEETSPCLAAACRDRMIAGGVGASSKGSLRSRYARRSVRLTLPAMGLLLLPLLLSRREGRLTFRRRTGGLDARRLAEGIPDDLNLLD